MAGTSANTSYGEEIPFLKTLQLLQFILFLDSMQSYKYKKTLAA